jgi:hypothetical protein
VAHLIAAIETRQPNAALYFPFSRETFRRHVLELPEELRPPEMEADEDEDGNDDVEMEGAVHLRLVFHIRLACDACVVLQ